MGTVRTPRKLRTKADFLIVGGGMAGISALAETRRLGINAICLEAHTKPGGRIRTVRNRRIVNCPIELGAEFVHGCSMRQLCESLGLSLIKHPSDGVAFVDKQFLPLQPILQVFKTIRDRAAAYLASGKVDSSVEEFLATLMHEDHELPPGINAHLLLQLIRNDFASRVSDLGLTGLLAPDVDGYEDNFRVAEGYDEVPRRLAAGSDVRCNHVASAIVRHRDCVEVITNRGIYSGNVVLICLPVGVLQAGVICFDPPLARAKALAIDSINAGTATKLVLCFRRNKLGATFWPKTMPLLATSLATQLWWPTAWGYAEQRRFLASCLVGGAAVTRFAERDPRRVGLAQLAHMFGWERVEGKVLAPYYVKTWHDDPRIKGGYSSLPVGIDHDLLLQELESPEDGDDPQLFFAGDYVTKHPGSAHSAYQSGIDAVHRAVARNV
ncbi:MAG TPA: NAD(P)/FAD-dependent oxidoreductase [Gemmataceae bacterium]|nr:NAD(P)/FAD-dependent oxidoreductase [Gemmataceae bacterium]